jgi:hypothetical protein
MLWMGCETYGPAINFNTASSASLSLIQNNWAADTILAQGLQAASDALDDFREMGEKDLLLNYSNEGSAAIEGKTSAATGKIARLGVFPNPFNPSCQISVLLPFTGKTMVSIFGVNGRLVKMLVNAEMNAGSHAIAWNGIDASGKQVTTGIYICEMKTGNKTLTKKVVLAR